MAGGRPQDARAAADSAGDTIIARDAGKGPTLDAPRDAAFSKGDARVLTVDAGAFTPDAASLTPEGPFTWPDGTWPTMTAAEAEMDGTKLAQARLLAEQAGGSGIITRHGSVVMRWGSETQRYDIKSSTKSFGATALGLAMMDGRISLNDKVINHLDSFGATPAENLATGWLPNITVLHLATHTAGFDKPGGFTKLLFEPGTRWSYSDGGPNWLADVLTTLYRRDLRDLMIERVFTPIGVKSADVEWRRNQYRTLDLGGIPRREFGAGISATVDAMARLGYLYLRGGRWRDRQILPWSFVLAARSVPAAIDGVPVFADNGRFPDASSHYGLLWWNNADETMAGVPRGAFWSWGLHDSLIIVIPELDVVVARAGDAFADSGPTVSSRIAPFLRLVAQAAQ